MKLYEIDDATCFFFSDKLDKDYDAKVKPWVYFKVFHDEFKSPDLQKVKRRLCDLRRSLESGSDSRIPHLDNNSLLPGSIDSRGIQNTSHLSSSNEDNFAGSSRNNIGEKCTDVPAQGVDTCTGTDIVRARDIQSCSKINLAMNHPSPTIFSTATEGTSVISQPVQRLVSSHIQLESLDPQSSSRKPLLQNTMQISTGSQTLHPLLPSSSHNTLTRQYHSGSSTQAIHLSLAADPVSLLLPSASQQLQQQPLNLQMNAVPTSLTVTPSSSGLTLPTAHTALTFAPSPPTAVTFAPSPHTAVTFAPSSHSPVTFAPATHGTVSCYLSLTEYLPPPVNTTPRVSSSCAVLPRTLLTVTPSSPARPLLPTVPTLPIMSNISISPRTSLIPVSITSPTSTAANILPRNISDTKPRNALPKDVVQTSDAAAPDCSAPLLPAPFCPPQHYVYHQQTHQQS